MHRYQMLGVFLATGSILMLQGCSSTQKIERGHYAHKGDLDNICKIYEEKPEWKRLSNSSYKKWRVPEWTMFAIIHQESRFVSNARPPRNVSSAYGYPQALDGTWKDYQRDTGNRFSSRSNMKDALDFIGWYVDKANKHAGVSKRNAFDIYLSYHEGWSGFRRGSYRSKPWLKDVARKVQKRAVMYKNQHRYCS